MAGVPGIIDLIKFPYSIILVSLFTEENGMKASHVHSFYERIIKGLALQFVLLNI